MAVNTKAVKTRINSVKNTKKITRAMQMISAVKMRKAVEAAVSTRTYSTLARELMENLNKSEVTHPFMQIPKGIDKALVIIITSNRGLCGNYNSAVLKHSYNKLDEIDELKGEDKYELDVIAIGKKAAQFAKKNELDLIGIYEKLSENPKFEDVLPIARSIIDLFLNNQYKKISIVYTNYISGLKQVVEERTLLPVTPEEIEKMNMTMGRGDDKEPVGDRHLGFTNEYEFEPSKTKLLEEIMPMLIEVQVYQAVLESSASEHSSRMIAMKNATESAGDMIEDLTLEFNKGRQAAITQEISEITAGANAL